MIVEAPTATGAEFQRALVSAGHVLPTAVPGLVGHGPAFEKIVAGLSGAIRTARDGEAVTELQFPPVEPRAVLERCDYVDSFPQLVGSIHVFDGTDSDHASLLERRREGADWTGDLTESGLSLVPAACHPLYATLAGRRVDPPGRYAIQGFCFRHEPSHDPARMVSFRMQEEVFVGDPDGAVAHRERWLERLRGLFTDLGLEVDVDVADDPFFGRAGRLMRASQRAEALKFEIRADIAGRSTAIASGNAHRDHFGAAFGLTLPDGGTAHSACAGVGLERAALALLWRHGVRTTDWPGAVRGRLDL